MTGAVEWGQIIFIVGLIVASTALVLTSAWFMWQRIAEVRSKGFAEINAVQKELNEFKLKVTEEYVKRETLSDVEARFGRVIGDFKNDVNKRLDDIKDLVIASSRA